MEKITRVISGIVVERYYGTGRVWTDEHDNYFRNETTKSYRKKNREKCIASSKLTQSYRTKLW